MAAVKWDGRVCKFGFPIRTCGRCGGSGKYSYNAMHGDRCYGCSGTGVVHTAKGAKAFAAWRQAWKRATEVTGSGVGGTEGVAVGDQIRRYRAKDEAWRTVTAVQLTDEAVGWSNVNGEKVDVRYAALVTLDDGTTVRMGAETWSRKGTVDKAEFLRLAGVTGQQTMGV